MKTKLPWKEAIIQVLRDSGTAMSHSEIAEEIVAKKLRDSVGATPANTVVATITTSIVNDQEASPFIRVGRGQYALRSLAEASSQANQEQKVEIEEE
jgi:hypothetical protein